MADFKVSGRTTVGGLKKQFKAAFGSSLRVYKGKKFADDTDTLASIRKEGAKGGEMTVKGNMKVGNFEKEFELEYGIAVQVANADDTKLVDNGLTLTASGKL